MGSPYDGNMSYGAYDQGPQDDMNGYSNYDSNNSYYQNYGADSSSQYGYNNNQGYGKPEGALEYLRFRQYRLFFFSPNHAADHDQLSTMRTMAFRCAAAVSPLSFSS